MSRASKSQALQESLTAAEAQLVTWQERCDSLEEENLKLSEQANNLECTVANDNREIRKLEALVTELRGKKSTGLRASDSGVKQILFSRLGHRQETTSTEDELREELSSLQEKWAVTSVDLQTKMSDIEKLQCDLFAAKREEDQNIQKNNQQVGELKLEIEELEKILRIEKESNKIVLRDLEGLQKSLEETEVRLLNTGRAEAERSSRLEGAHQQLASRVASLVDVVANAAAEFVELGHKSSLDDISLWRKFSAIAWHERLVDVDLEGAEVHKTIVERLKRQNWDVEEWAAEAAKLAGGYGTSTGIDTARRISMMLPTRLGQDPSNNNFIDSAVENFLQRGMPTDWQPLAALLAFCAPDPPPALLRAMATLKRPDGDWAASTRSIFLYCRAISASAALFDVATEKLKNWQTANRQSEEIRKNLENAKTAEIAINRRAWDTVERSLKDKILDLQQTNKILLKAAGRDVERSRWDIIFADDNQPATAAMADELWESAWRSRWREAVRLEIEPAEKRATALRVELGHALQALAAADEERKIFVASLEDTTRQANDLRENSKLLAGRYEGQLELLSDHICLLADEIGTEKSKRKKFEGLAILCGRCGTECPLVDLTACPTCRVTLVLERDPPVI